MLRSIFVACLLSWPMMATAQELTLAEAERIAVARDAEMSRLALLSEAAAEQAVADGQLPDPMLKLGAQNLPTDTFELDQEPMTQLRVALAQQFPAGRSLAIASDKTALVGATQLRQRQDRLLRVRQAVREAWLEQFYWNEAQHILHQDSELFVQLRDVTQSLYSVGRAQQQDVLRAELELSQLDDRLLQARIKEQEANAALAKWVGAEATGRSLPQRLPNIYEPSASDSEPLEQELLQHPAIQALDTQIEVADQGVALAKEAYKPAWGLEVAYGARQGDNPDGSSRADFVSAGVTVQLPLFTANRQDRKTAAALRQRDAVRDQRLETLRMMMASAETQRLRQHRLNERLDLFHNRIVLQAQQRAEAALAAYQADAADFTDVMQGYLSVQKLRLDQLRLEVDLQQTLARLAYFMPNQQDLTE